MRRLAVPERGAAAAFAAVLEDVLCQADDVGGVGAGQGVAAFFNGDRALGVLAHGDAGHAQGGGFFLQAAAVGQHQGGVFPQVQERHIGLRAEQGDAGPEVDVEAVDVGAGARVHREHQRQVGRHLAQHAGHALQGCGAVDIAGAVQGNDPIAGVPALVGVAFEPLLVHQLELVGLVQHVVDHHMADVEDRCHVLAFAPQVIAGAGLGDEEPVADRVGDEAVDFFGHAHVAAAQASLYMGDRDAGFLGHDGAGQGRVDIADYQAGGGLGLGAEGFIGLHDFAGLLGMAAAAGPEADIGSGDAEFFKEDVVHVAVVMLAGMDDLPSQTSIGLQRTHDRRDFHEVRPRAGDQVDAGQGH